MGCFGLDGFIDLLISGGIIFYDISWSYDVGLIGDFVGNLVVDDYSVIVMDVNGCEIIFFIIFIVFIDIVIEIIE